ncbi:hypothetical protein [Ligilactobacillus salivarius]|uniref:hypothetical protein n=1 Tax=Ligilactobacillus salivarius TaxID=1624 RepID=UPI0018A048E0|nr:hypothetical protein [Ligilactobacillus salivarius]
MVVVLSEKDRKEIFNELTSEQIRVIRKYVLDATKSELLTKHFMRGINWELVDLGYDPLFKKKLSKRKYNPTLYCSACGKPLKYQYMIRSLQTGYVESLGETCLNQRTGISLNIAKEVHESKRVINVFQDEILLLVHIGKVFPINMYKKVHDINGDVGWSNTFRNRILEFKRANLPLFHKDYSKLEIDWDNAKKEIELEEKENNLYSTEVNRRYIFLSRHLKYIVSKNRNLFSEERIKIEKTISEKDIKINEGINEDFAKIPEFKREELKNKYIIPFNKKLRELRKIDNVDINSVIDEAIDDISGSITQEVDDFVEDKHYKIAECEKVIQEVNKLAREVNDDDKIYKIDLNNDIDKELNFYKDYLEELRIKKTYPYKLRNSLEKDEILYDHDVIDIIFIKDELSKYVIDSQDEFLIDYYLKKQGYPQKIKIENLSLEDFEDKAIEEQRKILIYGILKVGFAKIIYEFEQEVAEKREKVNKLVEQIEIMSKKVLGTSNYISNKDMYDQKELFYHDEDYSKIIEKLTKKRNELEIFKNEFNSYPMELINNLHLVGKRSEYLPRSSFKIKKSYRMHFQQYQINAPLIKKYELLIRYYFEKYKSYHKEIGNYAFEEFISISSEDEFEKLDEEKQKNKLTNIRLLVALTNVIREYILKYEVAEKIKILNTLKRETEGENFVEYIRRSDKELGDIEKYCADLDKNINNKKYLRDIKKLAVEIPEIQRSFFGEDAEVINTDKYLEGADSLKYNPRKKKATELNNLKKKLELGIKRTNYVWKKPEYADLSKELDKIINKDISIENSDGVEIFKQIKAQSDEIASLLTKEEKQLVEYFLRKHKFKDIDGKYEQNIHLNITVEEFKNSQNNRKNFLEYIFLQLKLEKYIYNYFKKFNNDNDYIEEIERIISMDGKFSKDETRLKNSSYSELSTVLKDNLNIFRTLGDHRPQRYSMMLSSYNNKISKISLFAKKEGDYLKFIKESIDELASIYKSSKYFDWEKSKYQVKEYLSDYRSEIDSRWKRELISLLFELNYSYFGNSLLNYGEYKRRKQERLLNANVLFLKFINNKINQIVRI